MENVFLITGGGTGGHLIIAKTFAQELKKMGYKVIFVGSNYGQDKMWFENANYFDEKYFLQSSGVVNKKGIKKIVSIFSILKLSFKCKEIFKKHKVSCVISVGGYSSAPASFCALALKIPFFIHEQNARIGKLNSLLKPYCKGFYSSYFEPKFNYVVNDVFFQKSRIRTELKTIIFLGGSQGARFINDLAIKLAPKLQENKINIIHQCGKNDFDRVKKEYENLKIQAEILGFCENLHEKMSKADLCIARSGASTLWELCANCLPSIFIPFPYAAGDHQYYNAKFLYDSNLCQLIREEEANEDRILDMILKYDILNTSRNLKNSIKTSGLKAILDDIFKKIKNENV